MTLLLMEVVAINARKYPRLLLGFVFTVAYSLIQLLTESFDPLFSIGRKRDDGLLRKALFERREVLFSAFEIHFVSDDDPFKFREVFIIHLYLCSEGLQVFDGVSSFATCHINDKKQDFTTCDVAEKFMA